MASYFGMLAPKALPLVGEKDPTGSTVRATFHETDANDYHIFWSFLEHRPGKVCEGPLHPSHDAVDLSNHKL